MKHAPPPLSMFFVQHFRSVYPLPLITSKTA